MSSHGFQWWCNMKLNNILTREQETTGLSLYDDEDMVYLSYRGKVLAAWSARGATPAVIRVDTQIILDKLRQIPLVNPDAITGANNLQADHFDIQHRLN